jgi:hypothetical protein
MLEAFIIDELLREERWDRRYRHLPQLERSSPYSYERPPHSPSSDADWRRDDDEEDDGRNNGAIIIDM